MMTSLLMTLVVSASPARVGVTLASRVGVSDADALTVERAVSEAMSQTDLEVMSLTLTCRGEENCLMREGQEHDVQALVSLGLARGPTHVIIDVEVLSVRSGKVLGQQTWKWKSEARVDSLRELMASFSAEVAQRVRSERAEAAATAVVVADAPLQPRLLPQQLAEPTLPQAPSRAPAVVFTVGAGVALVATALLTGAGLSQQAELPLLGSPRPPLPLDEAQRIAEGANNAFTGAAIAGGLAGGMAITALVCWVTSR